MFCLRYADGCLFLFLSLLKMFERAAHKKKKRKKNSLTAYWKAIIENCILWSMQFLLLFRFAFCIFCRVSCQLHQIKFMTTINFQWTNQRKYNFCFCSLLLIGFCWLYFVFFFFFSSFAAVYLYYYFAFAHTFSFMYMLGLLHLLHS